MFVSFEFVGRSVRLVEHVSMRAMILAAGRGDRMGSLTRHIPKPLLEIDGKPLIVHRIERLRDAGMKRIVINLAYLGDQIRARLGDGQQLGVELEYSQEPDGALDTGGAIVAALPYLGEEPFAVVNSDVWTDFDFSTLTIPRSDAHLILVSNPPHNPAGDFNLLNGELVSDGGETATYSGIGVFRSALFHGTHAKRFPLGPLLRTAVSRGRITGEHYRGLWVDVGTPERLNSVRQIVASQHFAI